VSVGSNDLMQFLFAHDRGSARLAERYDPLAPAALACLRRIAFAWSAPASRRRCAARWPAVRSRRWRLVG
jgi:signal transduction protein with GAF and PtsI domain